MRKQFAADVERGRTLVGPGAPAAGETRGYFRVVVRGQVLFALVSDGLDWQEAGLPGPAWEHVSVRAENRVPTWAEMQAVKEMFWGDDETVMQLHPARADYVNLHKNVLHLWRPVGVAIPQPPQMCV